MIDDLKNAATELATKLQEAAKKTEGEAEQEKGKETLEGFIKSNF